MALFEKRLTPHSATVIINMNLDPPMSCICCLPPISCIHTPITNSVPKVPAKHVDTASERRYQARTAKHPAADAAWPARHRLAGAALLGRPATARAARRAKLFIAAPIPTLTVAAAAGVGARAVAQTCRGRGWAVRGLVWAERASDPREPPSLKPPKIVNTEQIANELLPTMYKEMTSKGDGAPRRGGWGLPGRPSLLAIMNLSFTGRTPLGDLHNYTKTNSDMMAPTAARPAQAY
ncbi:unnamed protein product [Plutella xylostella]|uniref:(diamondback moth) hypothetical protein n=1 Tax=Plutella xylostella TaxID=51655 RepID=A0A8S4GEU7_PLUXY|nr:unnamed protein product [Plutella xylostella]